MTMLQRRIPKLSRLVTLPRSVRVVMALAVCAAFANRNAAIGGGFDDEAGGKPIALPNGHSLDQVVFDRHVVPLLSRFGCNMGACHGSFQGRGGMRLSLFGHSPQMDYEALMDRIDVEEPLSSLAIVKPTGGDDHGGGVRFQRGDWPHRVLERWIEQGGQAPGSFDDDVELYIEPREILFNPVDEDSAQTAQLRVTAHFGRDDATEDVTTFCRFASGDPGVATVDHDGRVAALRPGATYLTAEYRGCFATAAVLAPHPGLTDQPVAASSRNSIDKHIDRQLKRLNLARSPIANDFAFLRRITLDVAGRLPTVSEIREFTTIDKPLRRQKAIDRLLADPRHAALWATRFCDMTRLRMDMIEGPEDQKSKRAAMWHDWFRVRLENNAPYDRIVRGIVCGTSVGDQDVDEWIDAEAALVRSAREDAPWNYAEREFCDLFWRRSPANALYPRRELAEITAAAFQGVRLQCAQCHKHPYDRWTQADYLSYVNVFSQVSFGSSTELSEAVLKRLERRRRHAQTGGNEAPLPRVLEVYNDAATARPFIDETTGARHAPRPLGGPPLDAGGDPRDQLMSWLEGDGRRQFAAAFVNRVWAHYFGRGLVEPVDGFSAINPPTHPELLDALADEFIKSGYNIRRLERSILLSDAYQRSSQITGNNGADDRSYARALVRPLLAEVAVDALYGALGAPLPARDDEDHGGAALNIAADRPADPRLAQILETFGRGQRKSACDCDRQQSPDLRKALFVMSDGPLMSAINDGQLLDELAAEDSQDEAIDALFLSTLSRPPTDSESTSARRRLDAADEQRAAWTDLVWALVNTREFQTNH